MSANQLAGETSPYLLQHRENPVHWRTWNPAALEEARREDKPILLSIGYAACHWCHVMARESFDDPATAALMNELFIPIKVDREERPDLDTVYQQALALLGGRGGWPLTMFLTPGGEPFGGGTYFPPAPSLNRPGFSEVLRRAAGEYRDRKEETGLRADGIAHRLGEAAPGDGAWVSSAFLDHAARETAALFDPLHGGLRNPPKFPNVPLLEMLWRAHRRTGEAPLRDAVLGALTAICQGSLHDHLGGGFFRYCIDNRWLVPHFEKMLYDNAQLIELLTWAWRETGAELWRRRVEETVGWVLREMALPDGAFAASLDADSGDGHEEGGYYVWTATEIDALLGADAALFDKFYNVTPQGNWKGRTILHRLRQRTLADAATEAALDRSRRLLLAARADRTPPARDDKVLADGNGLLIAAFAEAARAFDRPEWLAAARAAWDFLVGRMSGPGGSMSHSWRQGRSHPGTLDDYAALCRAGLRLHEVTGEPGFLAQVRVWVAVLDARFASPEGGYFLTDTGTDNPLTRILTASDGPAPSGNAVLVGVLGRLHLLTGERAYLERAESILAAFSGAVERDFLPLAGLLNGADFLLRPLQIAVIGDPAAPETREMEEVVFRLALPNRVFVRAPDGEGFPPKHPLHGKGRIGGRTTAYVCEGTACSLPLPTAAALRERLGHGPIQKETDADLPPAMRKLNWNECP